MVKWSDAEKHKKEEEKEEGNDEEKIILTGQAGLLLLSYTAEQSQRTDIP